MVHRHVLIGLGSNWGDRRGHLQQALSYLAVDAGIEQLRCSPIYETPPLLPEGAPEDWDMPYLNLVACGYTLLSPYALLARTQELEQKIGRMFRGHWGPREIDIDILDIEGVQLVSEMLTLPHPHMLHREFVMVPLADLVPDWTHPAMPEGLTLAEWNGTLPGVSLLRRLPDEVEPSV